MKRSSNILIITSWSLSDGLIQAYTLPYLRIIRKLIDDDKKIILVTQEKANHQSGINEIESGIWNIQLPFIPFSVKAAVKWGLNILKLTRIIFKKEIDVIHVWCTPSGMIGYILSLITGKKLIIDSFEPHAEAMVENGEWKKNGFAFKLLFLFEKLQTHHADYLVATTEGMKKYARDKYQFRGKNIFVKPACVDLDKFNWNAVKNRELVKKFNFENKIVGLYVGKFGGIYLEKEIFDFFKVAEEFWGNTFRILLLTSESRSRIEELAQKSNLSTSVIISEFVPHEIIENYIGLADFALTPVKPIPTKRFCTPIKDGEYWAMGLPVVITNGISDDSDIIHNNNMGAIIEPNNSESYKKAIIKINELLTLNSDDRYSKIREIALHYRNFDLAKKIYEEIYSNRLV